MKTKSGGVLLKRAVTAALGAIGIKEAEIRFQNYKIEIPMCNIAAAVALVDGARVWKAEVTYSYMRMEDAFENTITHQLFTVPLDDELMLARKLAIEVSIRRVDAALDAAASA